MYSYFRGIVTEITGNGITLEVNNIGYFIYCAKSHKYQINEKLKIFVYYQVREDEQSLFGFDNREQLSLFLKLINVKGLGCRMVLPMFVNNETKAIVQAIENDNINFLTSFPKIGEKLARQIILDLKGKLVNNKENGDLTEALKALGYRKPAIDKVINKIDSNLAIENQIKEALKLL